MRSGRRSVPIEILERTASQDALGGRSRDTTVWREVWSEYRAIRGGEVEAGSETIMATRVEFMIDFAEVMIDQDDGKGILKPDMMLRCMDELYNIIEILPDLVTQRYVRIVGVQSRVVR